MSTTVYEILNQLYTVSNNTRERGDLFERLMVSFLRVDPQYSQLFSNVWRWMDWPGRAGKVDTGIDIVAEEAGTGDIWAIQCKFYDSHYRVQKGDLDSFFTESGKHPYRKRMVIATAPFSKHAADACNDQQIPVSILDLATLEQSPIDWEQFSWNKPETLISRAKKQLRPHQISAITEVLKGFQNHCRGKLIMACGTGKTFTSLRLMEETVSKKGLVLFLVPSISLLSQTLREWTAETEVKIRSFAVCSDTKVGRDEEDMRASDLAFPATTNAKTLVEQVSKGYSSEVTVIFSTYQSIEVISEAQGLGLPEFDLVLCDEAHRTTGVQGDKASYFTRVHDNSFLRAKKRLYMTATPRIYAEASKTKAKNAGVTVFSMDDEEQYGPEFHRLNFSEAVQSGILSDYKVIILAVDDRYVLDQLGQPIHDEDIDAKLDDVAKIVGCWNALAKRYPTDDPDRDVDPAPMRRAVAFSTTIQNSKRVRDLFSETVQDYVASIGENTKDVLRCEIEHVDGTQNVIERTSKLQWLKGVEEPNTCHILTNARCLTEGVDVPALDAVMFLNPRNSQVDVVQAVGRVMRRAEGKQYGYVILPIAVSSHQSPEDALNNDKRYKVVWDVLNALRAHDDRFNDIVNKLELNKKKPPQIKVIGVGGSTNKEDGKDDLKPGEDIHNIQTDFLNKIDEWRNAIYAKIVDKCGERQYWERWAKDVADIAERHRTHIQAILGSSDDKALKAQKSFNTFLKGLHVNLNDKITDEDAIEMLAQHLITKPVFDALFEGYEFSAHNPVSQSMQKVLQALEEHALWKETESLERFYESVRRRASNIDNTVGKQKIVIELYDTFFRTAFKKMADRLGIVFTPVEIVDFILNSVEEVLLTEFGAHLSNEGVHVLDPFTGTGTFIVRLLQSGLIRPEDLTRKYREELHANEIVLLAYYIAAINIEEAYHRLCENEYEAFPGIVLTDTFQLSENEGALSETMFPENNERIGIQKQQDIRVIVTNPPYSIGQGSQNDNNRNLSYPHSDKRITQTYVASSEATNNKGLYDSYIRAIRWASDRLGNQGVIGFVTNGMFIDSKTADGLRKCLAEEFSKIYCFNLRGDQLHSVGEQSRREGGKIFASGSRQPIAITILIKNPNTNHGPAEINYHDIGDYLTREQKLEKIYLAGSIKGLKWTTIQPNEAGDWINQRNDEFESMLALGTKRKQDNEVLFSFYSTGIVTSRDKWAYNFSSTTLDQKMHGMVDFYNAQVREFKATGKPRPDINDVEAFINTDRRKISWSRDLKNGVRRGQERPYSKDNIVKSAYRPFCKEWLYFSRAFNEEVSKVEGMFPNASFGNKVISLTGLGVSKEFTCLMVEQIPDFQLQQNGQCFPLYYYEEIKGKKELPGQQNFLDGETQYARRDAISDWGLEKFRQRYGDTVSKEDIFYYVYGVLHSSEYRERFAADLKKVMPRIPFVHSENVFKVYSDAGRRLADLHLNYETMEPWPLTELHQGSAHSVDFYRVDKMRFAKGPGRDVDKTAIIYNQFITLSDIPLEAYNYMVNGRSSIEWIMDRYQIRTDKDSGIVNDPNEWSDDPRYIVDLIKRIVRVSIETQRIIESLPKLDFTLSFETV